MADAEDDEYEQEFEATEDDAPSEKVASERAPSALSELPPPSPLVSVAAPESDRRGDTSPPVGQRVRIRQATRAKPAAKKPLRNALDQVLWVYTVHAKRIRSLRVPVAALSGGAAASSGFPVIRDLRVFAVVDKQPMQSHGSCWKQEARVAEVARPLVVARRAASPSSATSPGRRSGVLQEATWKNDDGVLQRAFTMDQFRRLKAYSPRIKLFVFGIGANAPAESVRALSEDSPKRHGESIVSLGWFFLDLRTPDLPERWFKLQNSPFGGEIHVSTTFLPTEMQRERPFAPPRSLNSTLAAVVATRRREHSLSADSEYLRLGDRPGADVFLFTVFIRGAVKLSSVLQSAMPNKEQERAALQSGLWLSYSLFDVVVQTDLFYNLERAEFAPIRDSFRVMSSTAEVRRFVESQGFFSIYLCTQDRVLANANLPFDALVGQDFFRSDSRGSGKASIDGTVGFESSSDAGVSISFSIERTETAISIEEEEKAGADGEEFTQQSSHEMKPTATHLKTASSPVVVKVGNIKLSTEALKLYAGKESIELEVVSGEQAVRCPIRFHAFTADFALGECPDLSLELDNTDTGSGEMTLSVSCFSSATDHAIASSFTDGKKKSTRQGSGRILFPLTRNGCQIGECVLECTSFTATQDVEDRVPLESRSTPGVSHTYRVLVRLKALRDFETSRPVVVAYTNPFSGREQVESPLISVMKKAEVTVPDAYCLFELHLDEASMKEAMESPIIMDVRIALPDGSQETIGNAIFSLNFLYYSEEIICCSDAACGALFRNVEDGVKHFADRHHTSDLMEAHVAAHALKTCSIYLPVMSVGERAQTSTSARRVGAIQVEAYIEDTGPMDEEEVRRVEEMRVSRLIHVKERRVHFDKGGIVRPSNFENATGRSTTVETAALNGTAGRRITSDAQQPATGQTGLEEVTVDYINERNTWIQEQNAQQAQWKKRLAELEKARMDELEEEWARREEERSSVLKAAQAEYQKLEHKLRLTLSEVETRERKLALAESALERDQRMLKEDTDLLRKRLQSEQSHSLLLAQKQVDALEKRVSDLQTQFQAAERRALQVEEDFAEYRKQQRKVPESKLREEISSLKGQVAELEKAKYAQERAKEQAEANCDKMKLQLEKMAKLVQSEKKKSETKVIEDLEKLRLKYIAREERYVLDGDREELRAIKQQLDELRRVHVSSPRRESEAASMTQKAQRKSRGLRVATRQQNDSPRRRRTSVSFSSPTHRRHSWSSADASPVAKVRQGRDKNAHSNRNHNDRELQRLEGERDSLLASGVYDEDSYLVRELERRIVLRRDQLAQRSHGL